MSPRNRLREALKAAPDGATNGELSELSGVDPSQVTKSLRIMPDVYIDRWLPSSAPGGWSAVWVMAEIPEDCPQAHDQVPPKTAPPTCGWPHHRASAAPIDSQRETMSNAFNVGDATTTRDGRKARIICVDRKDSELPLLALITYAGGQEGVWAYTSAGRTYLSGHDLMPLPRLEDLAVDTPLLVRNHEDAEWANRHFAEVIDGKLLCWADGGTSWTAVGSSDTTAWQLWKLP